MLKSAVMKVMALLVKELPRQLFKIGNMSTKTIQIFFFCKFISHLFSAMPS